MKVDLKLDWCSYKAAKYACEHWHYSKVLPYGKMVKIGVWENNKFIGCVLFSWGANKNIGSPYNLKMTEVCELVRVALQKHESKTSKIISLALKMLKKQSNKLKLVVSYADTEQGHIGVIYQATNWIYCGTVKTTPFHFVSGRWVKQRMASSKLGSVVGTKRKKGFDKIKYLMPLDDVIRKQIEPLKKPYPKRALSKDSVAPDLQSGEGGANPTSALLNEPELINA